MFFFSLLDVRIFQPADSIIQFFVETSIAVNSIPEILVQFFLSLTGSFLDARMLSLYQLINVEEDSAGVCLLKSFGGKHSELRMVE